MIRLAWYALALALGLAVGVLLTATQAPPADPPTGYVLIQ